MASSRRLLPPAHLDGRAGVHHLLAAREALRGLHGNSAHGVLAQVLRNLQHQADLVRLHLQCGQDGRQLAALELHVHHGADDLRHAAEAGAGRRLRREAARRGAGQRRPAGQRRRRARAAADGARGIAADPARLLAQQARKHAPCGATHPYGGRGGEVAFKFAAAPRRCYGTHARC
jgi:hypothetical protein